MTDGFQNSDKMYRCIAGDCMGWRQFHLSRMKGSEQAVESHGYYGYSGRPELDWGGPPGRGLRPKNTVKL